MKNKTFKGKSIDMYNSTKHEYPASEFGKKIITKKYDFIFTKNGNWFYICSDDEPTAFLTKPTDIKSQVEECGEKWKVLDALSGEIIHEN